MLRNVRTRTLSSGGPAPGRVRSPRGPVALVAALLVVAAVGLQAAPVSATPPGAPRPIVAAGYKYSIRVYWAPPASDGGSRITGYQVERAFLANETANRKWSVKTDAMLSDTAVEDAVSYRYRIRATNADGTGPWSPWLAGTKVSDRLDLQKFRTPTLFVTRQFTDLFGRAPTAGELATGLAASERDSGITTATYLQLLVISAERVAPRQPVVRLYAAYFRRGPDHAGLQHWAAARRSGAKTLDDVSAAFATSSEFRRTYGSLSDAAFVRLVYRNVLGRTADPAGSAFWNRQLATGASSRGRMMTKFSESGEFVLKSAGVVLVADVHDALLGTAVPAAERSLWGSHVQAGGGIGSYATYLITLDGYAPSR